ncbi:MAG: von Willebrand factor type A domain-containing protein, partial [Chitinophagaceae bacterium]|nr:von Willebrand factor type A domain-containing protein [Chitinophagaceae bacterium]
MKKICTIWILLLCSSSLFSQYYLKGEIKDETGKLLSNVKIILKSSGYVYYSGSSGGFGIMSSKPSDSASLSVDGYSSANVQIISSSHNDIVLKMLQSTGNMQKKRLVSFTKDLNQREIMRRTFGGETYSNLIENEFVGARSFPETGFAVNIDKASYSNIRRFINMGTIVPPDAVRIEEMMNYFNFQYEAPGKDSVFNFSSVLTSCPWNAANQLLYLKICSKKLDPAAIPPANLVFLIDVSGSMDMPNRLPLLKSAFKLMVNNLREKDTVSIVIYGSAVGVWLEPTSGIEKKKILESIEGLYPSGATSGASGILAAYRLAKSKYIAGGNNRVILATDGDFNVGQTSEEDLEVLIS